MTLLTIGYEGISVQQLLYLLERHGVQTIVDVRELPLSRKAGFSKSPLALAASNRGIDYVHVRALGCPREIRHDYRADRDWPRYERRFMAYMETQGMAIARLVGRVTDERCCLLCYEADPNYCHRSIVARRIADEVSPSLDIEHLTNRSPVKVASIWAAA